MLVAIAPDGFTRSARWARRDEGVYTCPECHAEVILKAGRVMAMHFAHHPGSACHYGEGESERHLRMKAAVEKLWANVELEVVVLPYRRADAIVTTPKGGRFVVECQASPITTDEMLERTGDYNDAGYPVMWIWSVDLVHETNSRNSEWRLVHPLQVAHDLGGHRGYVMDHHDRLLTLRLGTAGERAERYLVDQDMYVDAYVPKVIRLARFQFARLSPLDIRNRDGYQVVVGREPWRFPGTDAPRQLQEVS